MTKISAGFEKFQRKNTTSHLPSQIQEEQEQDASSNQNNDQIRIIQMQGSALSIKSHGSSRNNKIKTTVSKPDSAYSIKSKSGTSSPSTSSSYGKKKASSSNNGNSKISNNSTHKNIVHVVEANSPSIISDDAHDDISYDSDDIRAGDCGSPFSSGGRRTPQSISNIVKTAAEVSQQIYKIGAAELQNLGLCGVKPDDDNNNNSTRKNYQSQVALKEEKEVSPYPLRQIVSSPVRCVSDDTNNVPVTLIMRRSISTPTTSLGGGSSAFRKPSSYYSLDKSSTKKLVESSLSAKAVKNIKDKRRARRVKNNNSNNNKTPLPATSTTKTITTAADIHDKGDDSSSSKKLQEVTSQTITDTSLDSSSASDLLNISKLTTSDDGSSVGDPALMLRTTMNISPSTSTITSSSPTKGLQKSLPRTIPPSPTITPKDVGTIASRTPPKRGDSNTTNVHFEEEESVGGESAQESGYQKFEDELVTNNKSIKGTVAKTRTEEMTARNHGRTQNVVSPVTYQKFVEEDEQPPPAILGRNHVVAPCHPRSTPPHNRKLPSPRFFIDNTSPARTTNSNNTSNQSSCGERSFTSSIEADREVMEMNRRERRRREADLLDGVQSVHSSDTASTNTQAYRALVTSSSNSNPREGASMAGERFFAISNNNTNNNANLLLGRPPPSNHQNRSPITVSSNYSSLANNTISSHSTGEEPPRFVSYPERKSSNVKPSSSVNSGNDNASADEEIVEYSKLGSGSGIIYPVNEDSKQRKKKNIDRRYQNMSSRTAKPPMNSSPIKNDAYDNLYRNSSSILKIVITDGTRTPTPPPTSYHNFASTPNSSDYLSHLSPPSQILESPLETQELQRRGAARPNFLPSERICHYGQDKMLLISPDDADAAASGHIISFKADNNINHLSLADTNLQGDEKNKNKNIYRIQKVRTSIIPENVSTETAVVTPEKI